MKDVSGSMSLGALYALCLVAALAGAFGIFFAQTTASTRRARTDARLRADALNEVETFIAEFQKIEDPTADSRFDIQKAQASLPTTFEITVTDESSKLNPNFVRVNLVEGTRLSGFLVLGATAAALQQRRQDEGLAIDIVGAYSGFFMPETLGLYFSPYSYGCVNTDDEFALRRLYLETTGDDAGSERFHGAIQRQLKEMRILKPEELEPYYGASVIDPIKALVTSEPQINANLADPWILATILSFPAFGVANPPAAAAEIAQRALGSKLDIAAVRNIVGKSADNLVYAYIGTKTWFWKLTLRSGAGSYRAILCRPLPSSALGGSAEGTQRLRLVEFGKVENG